MKPISLKQAMAHLQLTARDDGYELQNSAGSACYDAYGIRTTVNGIPEFFPLTLSLRDERSKPDEGVKPFNFDSGAVFINDAFIGNAIYSSVVGVNTENEEEKNLKLKSLISEVVTEQLMKAMRPGGLLWRR